MGDTISEHVVMYVYYLRSPHGELVHAKRTIPLPAALILLRACMLSGATNKSFRMKIRAMAPEEKLG